MNDEAVLYQDIIDEDEKNLKEGGYSASCVIAEGIYDWIFRNPYPLTFLNHIDYERGYNENDKTYIRVNNKDYEISVKQVHGKEL